MISTRKSGRVAAMIGLALIGLITSTASAQPTKPFGIFGNRKANTETDFTLTQSAGPWLIMCASFVGEEGEMQAQQLCQELSRDHKLKPYIYRQQFDYTRTVPGVKYASEPEVDENGQIIGTKYANFRALHNSQFEEIAVLVGDFPSIDHASAQRALEQIKHLSPKTLTGTQGEAIESTSQRMRTWREIQKVVSGNAELKQKGPMRAAFLMPNPAIPEEYFAAPKVDAFLIKVNRQVEYSLLDCPGIYTVKVATFRGDATFDLNQIATMEQEQSRRLGRPRSNENSKLEMAAYRANRVVTELRKLGVEAYEYHDRNESIACVGAFDWWKKTDASGLEIENPELQKVLQQFTAETEQLPGQPMAVVPKVLPALKKEKISFDVKPAPMLVPQTTQQTKTSKK